MSPILDERAAWDLVRAAEPAAKAGSPPARVEVASHPGVWVDVDAAGSWRASVDVSDAARDLLDVFLPIRLMPDIVVGQLGQSLDGRIATESGASHFVTGPKDIERLHRLRALVDAVVVGASTVAEDDPRLTVRLVEGRDPVRVVLDPSERLETDRRVFADRAGSTTLVVRAVEGSADAADAERRDEGSTGQIEETAAEELLVPRSQLGGLDLSALLERLREKGLRRILVEGGGVTVSRFLQAGLLDRLHVTVAPMLIGSGRPSIVLDPIESLDRALRPACRRFTLGEDVLFDLDFRSAHG